MMGHETIALWRGVTASVRHAGDSQTLALRASSEEERPCSIRNDVDHGPWLSVAIISCPIMWSRLPLVGFAVSAWVRWWSGGRGRAHGRARARAGSRAGGRGRAQDGAAARAGSRDRARARAGARAGARRRKRARARRAEARERLARARLGEGKAPHTPEITGPTLASQFRLGCVGGRAGAGGRTGGRARELVRARAVGHGGGGARACARWRGGAPS